eukprot:CAMPEP_0202820080 /NCGR_PEP_ID=MMETSP1389-20130828/9486_1 /ASSEMBLY_ACC=CAM_ASM_000865 /TAXON_ID=302021 /ORGANISM="Rhodomonas sp., Strain CCMP768" /LENGTH=62 /DNA_ID=CAMNT_0049492703 /DNA_START=163 /DNA_END=348 /DNA_ORIENTATION=-
MNRCSASAGPSVGSIMRHMSTCCMAASQSASPPLAPPTYPIIAWFQLSLNVADVAGGASLKK